MKLLRELTIKNLKLNKNRTLVTILGILLSVALMVTVTTTVSSLQATLREAIIKENGNYHVKIIDDKDKLEKIKSDKDIESFFINHELGYADIGSKDSYKPYLKIIALEDGGFKNNQIKLIEGRLPENSNEIVVAENVKTTAKVDMKLGETINLSISDRIVNGKKVDKEFFPNEEELKSKYKKEFKVVGIINRVNKGLEDFSDPGITALTIYNKNDNNIGANESIYYKIKNNVNIYQHKVSYYGDDFEGVVINYRLLETEGFETNDEVINMLHKVAFVILLIILATSIVVIKNSFSISIVEKTKQYGILKSLGASNSQIRRDIFFEGFALGSIGIVSGVILGIIVNKILIFIMNTYLREVLGDMKFISNLSIRGILIAVFTSALSIFISSYLIARRVKHFSAIESIRSSKDISNNKKIKTPKYIESLFGVSGLISHKNFKRDKKRYRTTTISITLIVIIFIALFSASSYLKKAIDIQYQSINYNIEHRGFLSFSDLENNNDYKISKKITTDVLKDEKYFLSKTARIKIDSKYANKDLINDIGKQNLYTSLVLVEDDVFNELAKENNVSTDSTHLVSNKYLVKNQKGMTEYKMFDNLNIKLSINEDFNHIIYDGMPKEDKKLFLSKIKNLKNETLDVKLTEINETPIGFIKHNSEFGINIFARESDYKDRVFIDDSSLYIKTDDDIKTVENIENFVKDNSVDNYHLSNITQIIRQVNSVILMLNIFSFGFIIVISLIALTSTFNTITSNMILRKREFATLRSIGVTNRNIKEMVRLESLFLGIKSLIFGIPIGLALSYLIYYLIKSEIIFAYYLPITSIIISIAIVFLILYLIMNFAVKKVDRLNIVETIKNENI